MDARKYYDGLNERRKHAVRTNTNNLIEHSGSKSKAFEKALIMDKKLFDELERRYAKWSE
jgi:hypothetical protein